MYIPKKFKAENLAELLQFMRTYSFATVVSSVNGLPYASHLPLTLLVEGDVLRLTGHFAKANPQWKDITSQKVLVIFQEPHAYISPKHYDNPQSVPTWNYIAVHAYGDIQLLTDDTAAYEALENMISQYEPSYLTQWNNLSSTYKENMRQGIVAFEILITDLQGSTKLSQNKSRAEQLRIHDHLSSSDLSTEKELTNYMHIPSEEAKP